MPYVEPRGRDIDLSPSNLTDNDGNGPVVAKRRSSSNWKEKLRKGEERCSINNRECLQTQTKIYILKCRKITANVFTNCCETYVKIYIFAHVESYVSHVIRGLLNSLLRCRNKQGYISKNDCERS